MKTSIRRMFGIVAIACLASLPLMSFAAVGSARPHFAGGAFHTVALQQDGSLWAWGANWDAQLGDGTATSSLVPVRVGTETSWRTVTAGYFHSAAIRSDGTLWAWGNDYYGQLGDGSFVPARISPVQVAGEGWTA